MDLKGYQVLTWSLTAVLLASFAGFALIFAYLRKRRLSGSVNFNQEEFITARRQVRACTRDVCVGCPCAFDWLLCGSGVRELAEEFVLRFGALPGRCRRGAFWCIGRLLGGARFWRLWGAPERAATAARPCGRCPPPRPHATTLPRRAPSPHRHGVTPQVGALRIGWSFFAGALGAWVISSPPSYTGSGFGYGAGAIGLAFYSLSSGLPVIMIAFAGDLIRVRRLWSAAAAAAAAAAAGATVVAAAASAAGPATMLRHGLAAAPLPLVATVRTSPCHSLIATSRCVSSSAAQGAPRAVPHRLYGVAVRLGGQDLRCHPLPAQHVHWWVPPLRRPPPPPLWPPLLLLLLRHCCPSAAAPPAAAPVCCSLLSAAATAVAQHLCRPIPTDVYFHLPLCSHPG